MFTIADLVKVLLRQTQTTELQTLSAVTTLAGLELSGRLEDGRDYRIVSALKLKPPAPPTLAPAALKRPGPKPKRTRAG